MFKINLLSKLTLISCIYITVVPCFIVNESPFVSKQNQLLIQKTDLNMKTESLKNFEKTDDTAIIKYKKMDSLILESDRSKTKIQLEETTYISLFSDNGAPL